MNRPIGVTLLAVGAGLAGLFQIYRILVFAGIVDFTVIGQSVQFDQAQWGSIFWSAILALIWFWVAAGFWNLRAYAWSFGNFVSLFTLIWGFFEVLFGGSSIEYQTVPWFLALVIFMYLNYPGVQKHFVDTELARLTPEQRAALEQLQAANAAAASAQAAPAPAPAAPPPAPAAPAQAAQTPVEEPPASS